MEDNPFLNVNVDNLSGLGETWAGTLSKSCFITTLSTSELVQVRIFQARTNILIRTPPFWLRYLFYRNTHASLLTEKKRRGELNGFIAGSILQIRKPWLSFRTASLWFTQRKLTFWPPALVWVNTNTCASTPLDSQPLSLCHMWKATRSPDIGSSFSINFAWKHAARAPSRLLSY